MWLVSLASIYEGSGDQNSSPLASEASVLTVLSYLPSPELRVFDSLFREIWCLPSPGLWHIWGVKQDSLLHLIFVPPLHLGHILKTLFSYQLGSQPGEP